jgi:hypothetical protein
MAYPGPDHFEQLLAAMLTPNTEVVMSASTELNKLLKVSACVPVLFHLVCPIHQVISTSVHTRARERARERERERERERDSSRLSDGKNQAR